MGTRRIKTKLLLKSAVVYRLLTLGLEFLVMWGLLGKPIQAAGVAVVWNIVNVVWYYTYHYYFARHFKIGDENANG